MLDKIGKPALLRALFELGVAYNSQILSYTKMLGQFDEAGNTTTLARYLTLLGQAGLLCGLNKYSAKPVVTKASIPKLLAHNTALVTAEKTESFEDGLRDPRLWGSVYESAVGAYLQNCAMESSDLDLYYWREGNWEMDFVLRHGNKVLGIEVKSNDATAARNAAAFKANFPGSACILVGRSGIPFEAFMKTPPRELV